MKTKKNRVIVLGMALLALAQLAGAAEPHTLTIGLRGVYDSKITLTPFNGVRTSRPLRIQNEVKSGGQVRFEIPEDLLPGEFLIRFDYRKTETDTPYPGELQLYLNNENIEVYANPMYLRGDSLKLINDRENAAWNNFSEKVGRERQQIGLLEQLLGGYGQRDANVWKEAAREYKKRCGSYNQWIDSAALASRDLYVSHLFRFLRISPINWAESADQNFSRQAATWFDTFNFNDTLTIRSRQMNEFINSYVAVFGSRAIDAPSRDSLFTRAGRLACERASSGHPKVYGWMVDYFFNGYESYNITSGLKMLEKHVNNPRCLTSRKQEVLRRLEGIKRMVPGVQSPNVKVQNEQDKETILDFSFGKMDYHLLVFYDSECSHCNELLAGLQKWYERAENRAWLDIYSVSIDNDSQQWKPFHQKKAFPWYDAYAPGGINSEAANNYYVLAAPVMFVMDKNGVLKAQPNSVDELDKFLNGK